MRPTRITVLLLVVAAGTACGIDAVGTFEGAALPDGSSPPGKQNPIDGAPGQDDDASTTTTEDAGSDAATDATDTGVVDTGVDVTPLVPPYLVLTHATAIGATINLTTEGTTEWAYWGVNGNANSIRNAGATNVISSLLSNGSSFGTGQGLGATLTFSNGAGSTTGSYDWYRSANQIDTSGSQIVSAPSGPLKRTFTVIVGGTNLRGRMTASLSDGSVTAKVDNTYSNLAGIIAVKYVAEYATVGAAQVEMKWEPDVVASGAQLRFAAAALK